MAYYPLFVRLEGKECLVVGGGEVAERKVASLLDYGARVRVVSPSLSPGLKGLVEAGRVSWVSRSYESGDSKGAFLAFAATDDNEVNQRVAQEVEEAGGLVNVVDSPRRCRFIVPAVVRRGELVMAVSTGGHSPALAKRVRRELEERFPPEYALLVRLVSQVRKQLKAEGRRVAPQAWQEALDQGLRELLRQGKVEEAKEWLLQSLQGRRGNPW
ncbi:MAG: bifunctional precorrin-2 dehydrogenase/sirohydrochlorin ferrochelatase [Chloroflexi bacterium]|nr:bifunctional precorrin-2 dehydrogenase/sirohydrochlorin ferrochelatase [Chloroflexota bacterium]